MNLYGFAGGDPVNLADPLGLCPNPLAPGLGNLQCVLEDAIAGGKQAARTAGDEVPSASCAASSGVFVGRFALDALTIYEGGSVVKAAGRAIGEEAVLGFKVLKSNFAGEVGATAGKVARDAAKASKVTDVATKVAGAAALDATDAGETVRPRLPSQGPVTVHEYRQ